MKIGIITLNGFFNYGNRLQNYALQIFLENILPKSEINTIWYDEDNFKLNQSFITIQNIRRYLFNRHGFRKFVNSNMILYDVIREYNIKKFSDKYINTIFDYKIASDLNNKYDYFVVGSDQVWNPYCVNVEAAFIKFADSYKRIAYSASFGVENISREKLEDYKYGLDGMEYISVREEAGAKIVKDIIKRDVPVLVDPTLLLAQDEWCEIINKPSWYKDEKYILLFFLSNVPKKVWEEVGRLANENGYNIIDLMDKKNLDYYASSPDEFLYLIKNASLVYTDSFHGTVFSIIMRVPFVNCPRENVGMNMNSRIDTLLKLFKLESRKGNNYNNYAIDKPFEIDYNNIDEVLNKEREKSKKYLLRAFNIME